MDTFLCVCEFPLLLFGSAAAINFSLDYVVLNCPLDNNKKVINNFQVEAHN